VDIKDFHTTLKLFKDLGLTELNYEDGNGFKLQLTQDGPVYSSSTDSVQAPLQRPLAPSVTSAPVATPAPEEGVNTITAPLVGTLYLRPSPEEKEFVKKGTQVKKGDTLFIVEAMKVMNEVKSSVDGEVVEILESPGAMVDFGRPILKIRLA
jgi:acetyl-CoA carboxylase biotin carboxyl carrier protein